MLNLLVSQVLDGYKILVYVHVHTRAARFTYLAFFPSESLISLLVVLFQLIQNSVGDQATELSLKMDGLVSSRVNAGTYCLWCEYQTNQVMKQRQ